ncbi:MAG: TrkH family potassium uptake protein [Spirochaetes bacterium]|nr:TrkH family potassium uptake protein [Spirochaetota bacterium]
MNPLIVFKIISILCLILSAFMIIPAVIAFLHKEDESLLSFVSTIGVTAFISCIVLFATYRKKIEMLSTRDGFLLVTLSWLLASLVGAMPFYFSGSIPAFVDAFFETISGFSTTGASILTDIESLPKSILFWRSLTHWLGGMGIVVLAVAILPMMGIGGLQLIRAEAPGPTVDRITPRITETAKILWFLYVMFTIAEALLLMLCGLDWFDSFTHAFGTLATGGFSTKNASVGHYNSAYVDAVVTMFMLIAGINFSLHYRLFTGRIRSLMRDSELKVYLGIFLFSTAIIAYSLYGHTYTEISKCMRFAAFQAASIMTTTGFANADFERWAIAAQVVLFILMFVGGCAGSTGGGIKVVRLVILFKQAINEMKLLIHPRGVFTLKISGSMVKKNIVYAVSGFFFLYVASLLLITSVVASGGHDIVTSFTAALATLGNIGPGFGHIGPTENYSFFQDYIKWSLSFAMLVGRLELYTVLVILMPWFWKR